MTRPKQDYSIRDGTARLDTVLPIALMQRLDRTAASRGLTRRALLIVMIEEGCAHHERRMLDAEQAAERAS